MNKLIPWQNWLEALSQVSVLIYLSLLLLALIVPNLSSNQEYRVFGTVTVIAMMLGFVSLRLRESRLSNMKNKTWTLDVKEDPTTGDAIIEFPEDFLEETKWREGDRLRWIDNKDGSWTLKKVEDDGVTAEEEEAWQALEKQQKK